MDNKPNAPMQVDPSTNTVSTIQAFKMDPSTEWVIESAPGFVAIKHKMGCSTCNASASHCMATKRSYEICLTEKDVSHAVAEAWPELVRYQDDYYCLLEDYNILKESNLGNQVQSLEKELQEAKDNSAELSHNEDLILENKRLKKELEYYVGRAQYALHGKDAAWAEKNGYRLSDIPTSDGEDNEIHLEGLHVNINDADIWYWVNLIKPKYHGVEAEVLLQHIFSSVGRWDQLVTG
ncbi:hypothetical protein M422DRAFT_267354 [Sphaerobolus stellatus SS14]|uniref:Uncharacterized protein n=1 Tax=Sphaerobolus stellatus (strain SS14) TaxID=990650 RepID=A0A0C9V077_SPHS4|nr:hypothetical protein M422DRAFT_267354 [Sphaerobolus stellatus SS14]